ncbi:MAG: hypothetical protein QXY76_03350 [Nitrososphaeria archaeon]
MGINPEKDFEGLLFEPYVDLEYPRLQDLPPDFLAEFQELIDIGSEVWSEEISGYVFKFGMLSEWEERAVQRALNNFDLISRAKLNRIEVLTRAIISITTPSGKTFSFLSKSEKMALRNILNAIKPPIIEALYAAYEKGAREIKTKIETFLERKGGDLDKGFFGQSGLSLDDLDLNPPGTQNLDE